MITPTKISQPNTSPVKNRFSRFSTASLTPDDAYTKSRSRLDTFSKETTGEARNCGRHQSGQDREQRDDVKSSRMKTGVP